MDFFRRSFQSDKDPPKSTEPGEGKTTSALLLVIQADAYDWASIFRGVRLRDGRTVEVVQAGWERLLVSANSPSMSRSALLVDVKPDAKGDGGGTYSPDFVLVRNEARGALSTQDCRNALFGMMYAGVPAVNTLSSIYSFLERPVVQAALNGIERRLGGSSFPLIPQSYFAGHATMMYGSGFPCVLKVGHAHAGLGKMRVQNHHDWEDVRSVVAVTDGKYCTAEPFIEGDFDVRIQKIGHHYRAYKRMSISGNWKTNTGCSIIEEVDLSPNYKLWADEASKIFGGLDICTVDVVHDSKTEKEYILEVNGTSSGLLPERSDEDNGHIRDLTIEKMNAALCPPRTVGNV